MEKDSSFKVPIAFEKPKVSVHDCVPEKSSEEITPGSSESNAFSRQAIPKPSSTYSEPSWSEVPDSKIIYGFEVLKSGVILERVNDLQMKAFWVFGRLPDCDIVMAHPTISRYHAVLQYRKSKAMDKDESHDEKLTDLESGWYLFDLNSTHGTFLNKKRLPPKKYIRVRVGHIIQLGASTRKYILQGPDFDEELESELSVTQLKEKKQEKELEALRVIEEQNLQAQLLEKQREEAGVSWGMAEDADEETDLTVNPYASTNNEELFLDDPKKTLRGFFEREGLDLEYKVDEMSTGSYVCRIELPIDDSNGRPIMAEISHKGKKKDAVHQGALEACRILDRHGVLRRAIHEPRKRKQTGSDSDDDNFFDRTGDVERKRERKLAATKTSALSYDDLLTQEKELLEKLEETRAKIKNHEQPSDTFQRNNSNHEDDLDEFMTNLKYAPKTDKIEIRRLRFEVHRLEQDHVKLKKLIKIAAPLDFPSLLRGNESNSECGSSSTVQEKKFNFPLFGKRNKIQKPINLVATVSTSTSKTTNKGTENCKSDDEETEDNDEGTVSSPKITKLDIVESIQTENTNKIDKCKDEEKMNVHINSSEIDELAIDKSNSNKKRRPRQRIRDKNRENVDMNEDEIEDLDKYSKWVPPENQAGDGYTSLNDKFGY